ncbi:hypothetical protein [Paenibacillus wenxiniae]|uniref:Uncharacterized protein n=1 Tax=Paenibacillus wenxiniae TaxID=1636843 RepID=A0ABW4RIS2_9BACL
MTEPTQQANRDTFELDVMAIGKRIGLDFSEMNQLRVRDLFGLANSYTGREENKDRPRDATQSDIDSFYSR